MRGYFFPTDYEWFSYLSSRSGVDEVNFWRPSARTFKALRPGEPFFFKLKAPHNTIGGFGFFARYVVAPISLVWESFVEKNGASSLRELRRQTSSHLSPPPAPTADYPLGCIMVSAPVFFPERYWIPQPADFRGQAVSGKGYELEGTPAGRIFQRCLEVAEILKGRDWLSRTTAPGAESYGSVAREPTIPYGDPPERFGASQLIKPRLGQGTFRLGIVDAYGRACAVSREHSLPVLEAAHIRPYAAQGTHELSNGVLLRMDIHRLFDRGYVTIDPGFRFIVSRRLKEDYDNGRTYYEYQGKPLSLPEAEGERPAPELLRWHNEQVFLG